MWKKLLFFFVISQAALSYSYFYFDKDKVNIDPRMFRRYILPQLRSITVEFYYILAKMNENNSKTVAVKKKVTNLVNEWLEWRTQCLRPSPDCNVSIVPFYQKMKEIDRDINRLYKNERRVSSKNFTDYDSYINYLHKLDILANSSYPIVHKFEQLLIHTDETFLPYPLVISELAGDLHNLKVETELLLFTQFDKKQASQFYYVWNSYIRKIESVVLPSKSPKVLVDHLESLNLSWNAFNMELIRGDLNVPKKLQITFKVMHNRWNSVLKIILKR